MEVMLCIKFRMYDACIYVLYGCVCVSGIYGIM